MKAALVKELGTPDVIEVTEIDAPLPGKGQALIDVKAAGLNFPDVLVVAGKYQFKPELPFSPGFEVAGVISELGEGVTGLEIGDRVIASVDIGGFAEKTVANLAKITKMPDEMSFAEGAGFTITYCTTYHAYKQRADLKAGETVLVLGAAGGVGITAIELAKAMGATVIAAASTDEKLETAKNAGADLLINYSTEDLKARVKELTQGKGVDVIYDPVGDKYAEPALRAIAVNGRYLVIGFAAGEIPRIPLNLTLLKQCQIVGVFWGAWAMANPEGQKQNMQDLFELFKAKKIKPLVRERYSLDDIKSAYACLTERRAQGKVIIEP